MGLWRRSLKKLAALRQETEEFLNSAKTYNAFLEYSQIDPDAELPERPAIPWPLQLYQWCKDYHCLLVAGGILDQPGWLWIEVQAAGDQMEDYLKRQMQTQKPAQEES